MFTQLALVAIIVVAQPIAARSRCCPPSVSIPGPRGPQGPQGETGAQGPAGPAGPAGSNGTCPSDCSSSGTGGNSTWLRAFSPNAFGGTPGEAAYVGWGSSQTSTPADWTLVNSTLFLYSSSGVIGSIYLINYEVNFLLTVNNAAPSDNALVFLQGTTKLVDVSDVQLPGLPTTVYEMYTMVPPGVTNLIVPHSNTYLLDTSQTTTFRVQATGGPPNQPIGTTANVIAFGLEFGSLNIEFVHL